MTQVLFLELNEINFAFVEAYAKRGLLPNFARLIALHGVSETTSEAAYEQLEPWIQWVTAHTGLALSEHQVFRLGDIVNHHYSQIWDVLENQGLNVGAVSPMNANNLCTNPAFFLPDPWTSTETAGSLVLRGLGDAVSQAVNDNAQSKITLKSLLWLLCGAGTYASIRNYPRYFTLVANARGKPWSKALFLDLLLADVFVKETRRARPDFASVFLNAGAHIQHHYMFSSAAYDGDLSNPEWYVSKGVDPIFEVYQLYDDFVGRIALQFPEARLMIATGLHQDPHLKTTYYWRLKNHAAFLELHGIEFISVEPRMSRDFLILCDTGAQAQRAESILCSAKAMDGTLLFDVDNRGTDLFVMLTYPNDIGPDFSYQVGNKQFTDFKEYVAFVAIKNGGHNGTGYFLDTSLRADGARVSFPLAHIPQRICKALGVNWRPSKPAATSISAANSMGLDPKTTP